MRPTTYDVRVWTTKKVQGARGAAYQVRWSVAKKAKAQTFHTRKLAESFRSGLITASRQGEAFDMESGLPVSMLPKSSGPTWLEFAMEFMDMKWPEASPRHRQSTAEGLVTITTAMLTTDEAPPDPALLRKALKTWAFNTSARSKMPTPPDNFAGSLAWISKRVRPVGDLADPAVARGVLDSIGRKLDGSPAAPSTVNRKRAALSSVIGYAIERGELDTNPLHRVKVKRRKTAEALDSRVVVNHRQAKALLEAVRVEQPALEAFLGCIYYAAMRPAEVRNLREHDLTLPRSGWGEAVLAGSYQDSGKDWTDNGELGEERALKHRVGTATRRVPLPPPLVVLLRRHLREFGVGPGGWLFVFRVGPRGAPLAPGLARPVTSAAVSKALQTAREKAFSDAEQRSH
jgi:integrase